MAETKRKGPYRGIRTQCKKSRHICGLTKEARERPNFTFRSFQARGSSNVTRLTDTPSGNCDLVSFELAGQPFMAISAGPLFKFNPFVSPYKVRHDAGSGLRYRNGFRPVARSRCRWTNILSASGTNGSKTGTGLSWQVIDTGQAPVLQKVTPVLMFVGDVCGKAEEAINFYVSISVFGP
jgi:predicted 3-demethylubiquinone-9 3-methyltransferase (glyoxalase superfamily)